LGVGLKHLSKVLAVSQAFRILDQEKEMARRMDWQDLRALSQIGQALWVDPALSRARTAETLQAVGLLRLSPERTLERASAALLARALREGERVPNSRLQDPFFRLLPEERLLLVGLHSERWSYPRLSRVLGCSEEQVASRAWKLRVHLASQRSDPKKPLASLGAAGVSPRRSSCPEFDPLVPWTQRFLDEEFAPRERLFLQNHLMACDSCRGALNRCRDLYYQVETMVPRSLEVSEAKSEDLRVLREAFMQVRRRTDPGSVTWKEAARAFVRQTETQVVLAALLTWGVWRWIIVGFLP
jgi:hypothetical protein